MKHKTLLVIYLLFTSLIAFGQKRHHFQAPNLLVETRANYGFLIAHHIEMEIFNKHLPSFEVSLARATYGKQQWETLYNYPVTGINYWNAWLGDPQTLGQAHALMPYIAFPIIKNDKTELNFRLAAGLGYLTQKFDRLHNYKYIAIGSHLNAAVNLMAEYRWKPIQHLQLSAGIQLMHFSNGSTKTPNFGLNIPSLSAGAAFRINKDNPYIKRAIRPQLTMYEFDGHQFIEMRIGTSFGVKRIGEVISEKYYVSASSITALKNIGSKGRAGICLDFSYDGSDEMFTGAEPGTYSTMQLVKPGVGLVYEVVLSRLSFPFAVGFYTGGKYNEGLSYYKIGMQYLISRNFFTALTLKTHFARADYLSLGIGYRFRIKQYWI